MRPDFLTVATPGSGKTTFTLAAIRRALITLEIIRFVVVPTQHLKLQWALAAERFELHLDPEWSAGDGALPFVRYVGDEDSGNRTARGSGIVHRTGRRHPAVNAELNRRVGIRRITEATVADPARRLEVADRWLERTRGPVSGKFR